jgi:hypothetical protein
MQKRVRSLSVIRRTMYVILIICFINLRLIIEVQLQVKRSADTNADAVNETDDTGEPEKPVNEEESNVSE